MKRVWMNRAGIAIAMAATSFACVKVPDSIKDTFAPHHGSEADNFSASAPHSVAPPAELTSVEVANAKDAGVVSAAGLVAGAVLSDAAVATPEGMCAREPSSSGPVATSGSPTINCWDAGTL